MRRSIAAALMLGAALPVIPQPAGAAGVPAIANRPASALLTVAERQGEPRRDCTPTNGPFGFYGNIWCQPPNEQSYLRNLGSRWPMETPPSLKVPKPSSNSTDW
jgi:hypothetical protein